MKKTKYYAMITVCLFMCVLCGCGYTTRVYIGPYQTIYIAPFKNSINLATAKSEYTNYVSYYPLIESTITSAVVDRFIFDGSLNVVKEDEADVIIKGELTSYTRGALRYAVNNEDVTEYRIALNANVEFYNNRAGKTIWTQEVSGDTTYYTTGSQAISEKEALDNAITDLVRRIVEAVVEAW